MLSSISPQIKQAVSAAFDVFFRPRVIVGFGFACVSSLCFAAQAFRHSWRQLLASSLLVPGSKGFGVFDIGCRAPRRKPPPSGGPHHYQLAAISILRDRAAGSAASAGSPCF